LRNDTFFEVSKMCNSTWEEILITLSNPLMDVNQINTTIKSESMPVDSIDAYLGTTCGKNAECGKDSIGKGLFQYETSFDEKITIWMVCLGNSSWNTTLNITAAYLRDYVELEEESEGLSKGGVAGIVIACVVAFLFIVGLVISLKGTLWFKSLFSCCKNKTQSIPDESPRTNQDIERRETGLAGEKDIAHQPSNQVPI